MTTESKIKLGSLFTDGAVFQRNVYIPVWGNAKPDSIIECELAGNKAFAASSFTGSFMARLPPLDAGGPHKLKVTNKTTGEFISISDILIGEVWLASGQSNMAYLMKTSEVQNKEYVANNSYGASIRIITIPKVAITAEQDSFVNASWMYSDDKNVPEMSAVSLWFAKRLHEELNVPVGIIVSAWGGTFIEAWTSRSALMQNPNSRAMLEHYDYAMCNPEIWEKFYQEDPPPMLDRAESQILKWEKEISENQGFKNGWHLPHFDDSEWKTMNIPGSWIEQGVAQSGIVWVRKKIDIPEMWAGKDIYINLGGIDKQDITYFNGKEVGRTGKNLEHIYWNQPRRYHVSGEFVKAGTVSIAIRAYSFKYDGGFFLNKDFYSLELADTEEVIPFSGEWKAFPECDFKEIIIPFVPIEPDNPNTPAFLFNSMIKPLIPYAVCGTIWYQGERNAHSIEDAVAYEKKMIDMINDWKYHWKQRNFQFIMVQLAGYRSPCEYDVESLWAVLRESQRKVTEVMNEVYMATAIDCGEEYDVHPADKRSVGYRLACQALNNTYSRYNISASGPMPKRLNIEGQKIRIFFKNIDGGLKIRNAGEQLRGFVISGEDKVFYTAKAFIDCDTVTISSQKVSFPCYVRYAWADNPNGNLYNGAGLPASSFEL